MLFTKYLLIGAICYGFLHGCFLTDLLSGGTNSVVVAAQVGSCFSRRSLVKQCTDVVEFATRKLIKKLEETEWPLGANCRENGTDLVSTSQVSVG